MKFLMLILTLVSQLAWGQAWTVSGNSVKSIRPNLNLNDVAYILTGFDDPTVVPIRAPKGSIFMRLGASGGQLYIKIDTSIIPTTGWALIGASSIGTVTSIGLSLPSIFNVTGSPVTTSGTLAASLATQSANQFFAGPTSGGDASPAFRSISALDIPTLNQNTTGTASNVTGIVALANGGTGTNAASANAAFNALSPLTTKGDLVAYSTTNARLPVGTNGQFLVSDSTQTTGLRWTTAATGANTTLSNLTSPVAVNQDFSPDSPASRFIGDSTNFWAGVNAAQFSPIDSGSNLSAGEFKSNAGTTIGLATSVGLSAGTNALAPFKDFALTTANNADVDANPTGSIVIKSGDKTAGTGNSGHLYNITGTSSGGTRGKFYIRDGSEGTSGHVWTSSGTAGEGAWMAASGGANTALSNLTNPTAINRNLIGDFTGSSWIIQTKNATGGLSSGGLSVVSGDAVGGSDSGAATFKSGDSSSNSGNSLFQSGDGSITSGTARFKTGDAGSGNSGELTIATGPSASADSGNIVSQTGTAGGTRGVLRFVDGSEGTAGYVWTSTDTTGKGAWMPSAGGGGGGPTSVKAVRDSDVDVTNPGTDTFDSVLLVTGDYLMLTGQSNPIENGVWVFDTSSTPLVRATGWTTTVSAGMMVVTKDAAAYRYNLTTWALQEDATVGTDPIVLAVNGFNPTRMPYSLLPYDNNTNNIGDATNPVQDLFVKAIKHTGGGGTLNIAPDAGIDLVPGNNVINMQSSGDLSVIILAGGGDATFNTSDVFGAGDSSDLTIKTGDVDTDNSGDLFIRSGNAAANSGNIDLAPGTAGTIRGSIVTQAHVVTSGTAPAVSSCGTDPSVVGNDTAGKITVGSGGIATSCTITFFQAFSNAAVCLANSETDIFALKVASTTTAAVITATAPFTASSVINYHCLGYQ